MSTSLEDASLDDLEAAIVGMAGRLSAAMCRWLLLVARFDAAEGAARWGLLSTARWLAWRCGLSKRTAVEHVRVARALAMFPALSAKMSEGRLSYSHVRAISRVAGPGEDALVDDLIMIAEYGTVAHLEVIVRGLRTVDDNEQRDSGWVPDEYVNRSWTDSAQWRLASRLDPEKGALVTAALDRISAAEGVNQVDALVRMAELALTALGSADDGEAPPGATTARALRTDEQAAVVIHLDAERFRPAESGPSDDATNERPYARIAGGPGLPDRVARRLLCAGRVRPVLRGPGGSVLDLGRSRRLVSGKQMQALMIRDEGCCTYPGCGNARNLHAHHIVHWLDGGPTNLANLVLLCEAHHLAHHNGEYAIAATIHGLAFTRDDGRPIPARPDPAASITTAAHLEDEHHAVHPDAATPNWDGQRLDRDYAISVIAHNRDQERERARSA